MRLRLPNSYDASKLLLWDKRVACKILVAALIANPYKREEVCVVKQSANLTICRGEKIAMFTPARIERSNKLSLFFSPGAQWLRPCPAMTPKASRCYQTTRPAV
jgi:hypothetical protein